MVLAARSWRWLHHRELFCHRFIGTIMPLVQQWNILFPWIRRHYHGAIVTMVYFWTWIRWHDRGDCVAMVYYLDHQFDGTIMGQLSPWSFFGNDFSGTIMTRIFCREKWLSFMCECCGGNNKKTSHEKKKCEKVRRIRSW